MQVIRIFVLSDANAKMMFNKSKVVNVFEKFMNSFFYVSLDRSLFLSLPNF